MIKVDISNVWGQVSLPDLLALEKEVFDAHMTLTEGDGPGNDFLGWLNLPVCEPTEVSVFLIQETGRKNRFAAGYKGVHSRQRNACHHCATI